MTKRRGALRLIGVGAVVVALPLGGCTGGADSNAGRAPRTEPSRSAATSPGDRAPEVTPPATPTAFDTAPAASGVRFRNYLGASVPGGRAGPRDVSAGTASGWTRTRAGAVLAAAHFAVALDARQPRALWTPAIRAALPRSRATRSLVAANRAADVWDAKLAADEKARSHAPEDGDAGEIPPTIWSPTIRVVAYSGLRVTRKAAGVVVWSRSDGPSTWRRRTIALQWFRGDWRVRLPLPSPWRTQDPPADIRPISELSR